MHELCSRAGNQRFTGIAIARAAVEIGFSLVELEATAVEIGFTVAAARRLHAMLFSSPFH
jgi:hypothetical protein